MKINPNTVYKFYADAGHGWLAVKRNVLLELGIISRISHYSYQRGETVYLEEDCDEMLFFNRLQARGIELKTKSAKFQNRSPIRSYESFKMRW